jgi:hypothetical protein
VCRRTGITQIAFLLAEHSRLSRVRGADTVPEGLVEELEEVLAGLGAAGDGSHPHARGGGGGGGGHVRSLSKRVLLDVFDYGEFRVDMRMGQFALAAVTVPAALLERPSMAFLAVEDDLVL